MERRRFIKSMEELIKSLLLLFGKWRHVSEKLIEEPRHIEIQVIEIQHGKVLSFRKWDCSLEGTWNAE
jgi:acetyl/propionyl-CoA carboxylase alpha subunit